MKNRQQTIIIAPPPTPNGDLHVGHLSGPYFGADVLRRFESLRGGDVVSALSVDLNQSYVVTTAQRLGEDPLRLARKSHAEVSETLERAGLRFDVVGMPDPEYSAHVSGWFRQLDAAGALSYRKRAVPFDIVRQRFMFESYASGFCPVCLSATKANICEACGHPNDAEDLLGLYPTGGKAGDPVAMREIGEYYLDLEAMRPRLVEYLANVIPEKRPALRRLIEELLSRPLPSFPVTFPSDWGIPAPFDEAQGLVLNVWAEMVPGHYYWIEKAFAARKMTPPKAQGDWRYAQFLGFDNSFFYVFAHLGLALAARDAGIKSFLPDAFVTNEFYLLDNFKFSTSQGHLIWGRDILADVPADEVRFYLAWSNPEYNQANFTRADMDRVLDKKFRAPLNHILDSLSRLSGVGQATGSSYRATLLERFEGAYDIRHPSLRMAALTVSNGFEVIETLLSEAADGAIVLGVAQAVACGLAPISPEAAERLWRAAGGMGDMAWPTDGIAQAPALAMAANG